MAGWRSPVRRRDAGSDREYTYHYLQARALCFRSGFVQPSKPLRERHERESLLTDAGFHQSVGDLRYKCVPCDRVRVHHVHDWRWQFVASDDVHE
jgi:hypothetical protein